ncbi:MAG: ribosome silencing factor [Burkholderiaceae bacterium]
MDIKTLQAVVIDALEDVKAQDIKLFDTPHLTSLFDRLAVASGTSNRQTKALAASVRDKVKEHGGKIISVEGADVGEWVLVDLGDMIVHIMQPAIRDYYRLEEIWGEKEIKPAAAKRPARRAAPSADGEAPKKRARRAATADADVDAGKAPARKTPAKRAVGTAAKTASKTAARTPAAKKAVGKTVKVAAPKSAGTAAKKAPAKTASKTAARKAPAKRAAAKSRTA